MSAMHETHTQAVFAKHMHITHYTSDIIKTGIMK